MNEHGLPDLLTPQEAAEMLGVHKNTIYNLCKTKEIPSFKFGNRRRIRTQALMDYISEQERREATC